jgi:hypothetical protein
MGLNIFTCEPSAAEFLAHCSLAVPPTGETLESFFSLPFLFKEKEEKIIAYPK